MLFLCSKHAANMHSFASTTLRAPRLSRQRPEPILRVLVRLTDMELLNPASCRTWPHQRWVYRLHSQQLGREGPELMGQVIGAGLHAGLGGLKPQQAGPSTRLLQY